MQLVASKDAPEPSGHYSQAVIANGLVFVSGILPLMPGAEKQIPVGITAQAEQVFQNLQSVLSAAKSDLRLLVNLQLFIPTIEFWSIVDEICRQNLGSHKPARTIIPCGALHYGAQIEANAIAVHSHQIQIELCPKC